MNILLNFVAFAAPLMHFLEVQFIGRLFLTEILLLTMLPFLLVLRGKLLQKRIILGFLLFGLLWLLAQIFSDIFRLSSPDDYLRGWAKIVFFLLNFCALYIVLYDSKKRIMLWILGWALGSFLTYFINPGLYALSHPWKFGYGSAVNTLIILLTVYLLIRHKAVNLSLLVIFFLGLANIYLGFRSAGGILLISGIYLLIFLKHKQILFNMSFKKYFVLLLIFVSSIWIVYESYSHLAKSGYLGDDQQSKLESQAYGDYGLLIGGRTEILVSTRAILDSPIVGYGSWAKDCNYSSLLTELSQTLGYAVRGEQEDCLIPMHSYLFGAWVESGIVGGLFWLSTVFYLVKILTQPWRIPDAYSPIVVTTIMFFLWAIMFSPFGAQVRISVAFSLAALLVFTNQKNVKSVKK